MTGNGESFEFSLPKIAAVLHPQWTEDGPLHEFIQRLSCNLLYRSLQVNKSFARIAVSFSRFEVHDQRLVRRPPVWESRAVCKNVSRCNQVHPVIVIDVGGKVLGQRSVEVEFAYLSFSFLPLDSWQQFVEANSRNQRQLQQLLINASQGVNQAKAGVFGPQFGCELTLASTHARAPGVRKSFSGCGG
jgi:hypothetical protein